MSKHVEVSKLSKDRSLGCTSTDFGERPGNKERVCMGEGSLSPNPSRTLNIPCIASITARDLGETCIISMWNPKDNNYYISSLFAQYQ